MLTVLEAAKSSGVSVKILNRWIKEGKLAAQKMGDVHLIDRIDLNAVLTKESIQPVGVPGENRGDAPEPRLSDVLRRGGIHYGIAGDNKRECIFNAMQQVRGLEDDVSTPLFEMFLAREELASTGIGDGIAIPHTRGSLLGYVKEPVMSLAFLEKPIDFGSLDGKPVFALFLLVAPNVKTHLFLLSRLAFGLSNPLVKNAVMSRAPQEEILGCFSKILPPNPNR